ncbi:MAG TPA: nucleotidyltransferase domain-containing protein [Candidatus Pacearchaeota archaeon]|nr:nucleotidyltransferase domain-containing protein [Candidatus Pacearchaeota archaeon]HOS12628.1 nucleotidyltransferase domain-containing protein [Candidatus Pacearchaeota archaeon]HRT18026.1 nucleotidyltransferase domain-containing protein [Candidatus Paceibacterota bacterium]
MLNLNKSKIRRDILFLFFLEKENSYYIRELERILGFSAGNIRRELIALKEEGIIDFVKKGNQSHYYLNKKSPIFNEIKSIISKTIGLEFKIKKCLEPITGIKEAFIFGSFAKEKEHSLSDIDLMIIGSIDEDILIPRISKTEELLGREINYHLISEDEWKKRKDKDSFIKSITSSPVIKII